MKNEITDILTAVKESMGDDFDAFIEEAIAKQAIFLVTIEGDEIGVGLIPQEQFHELPNDDFRPILMAPYPEDGGFRVLIKDGDRLLTMDFARGGIMVNGKQETLQ